jgi:hypothetical protein
MERTSNNSALLTLALVGAYTELTGRIRDLFILSTSGMRKRPDLLRAWAVSGSIVFLFVYIFRRVAKGFTERGAQEVLIDVTDEGYRCARCKCMSRAK